MERISFQDFGAGFFSRDAYLQASRFQPVVSLLLLVECRIVELEYFPSLATNLEAMKLYTGQVAFAATLFLLSQSGVLAEEPSCRRGFSTDGVAPLWSLERDSYSSTLVVTKAGEPLANRRYDISDCKFCLGEDDNCEQDGVFPIKHGEGGQKVAVGVTCHVGVHSQRIRIFLVSHDAEGPVLDITGNYFVSVQAVPGGVLIDYDGDGGEKFVRYWPKP
ncbi:MAG: hypothetical protein ACPG06_00680 [Alphaproteobacteria bacterium]